MTTKKEFIKVDSNHTLETESFGNPQGIPFLFIHGGPGASYSDIDKSFFNPEKHYVVFYHQRACGKSKFNSPLDNNTTDDLLDDITYLIAYYKLQKPYLFGGSWGSTLSLIYAIRNPNAISGLILRGIFLANRASRAYFQYGLIKEDRPEVWERFCALVPEDHLDDPYSYYVEAILNKPDDMARKFALEYQLYGFRLGMNDKSAEEILAILTAQNYLLKCRVQCHFEKHDFFIPENFILENCDKIQHIAIDIVHGENDKICLLKDAEELQKKLPKSNLYIENAGHHAHDLAIKERLIEIINLK